MEERLFKPRKRSKDLEALAWRAEYREAFKRSVAANKVSCAVPQTLYDAACQAEEIFSLDELEEYAREHLDNQRRSNASLERND